MTDMDALKARFRIGDVVKIHQADKYEGYWIKDHTHGTVTGWQERGKYDATAYVLVLPNGHEAGSDRECRCSRTDNGVGGYHAENLENITKFYEDIPLTHRPGHGPMAGVTYDD